MAKSYHGPDEFHDAEKTRFSGLFDVLRISKAERQ